MHQKSGLLSRLKHLGEMVRFLSLMLLFAFVSTALAVSKGDVIIGPIIDPSLLPGYSAINYDYTGGALRTGCQAMPASYKEGTGLQYTATNSCAPIRSGYVFAGWCKGEHVPDNQTAYCSNTITITEDETGEIDYFAHWISSTKDGENVAPILYEFNGGYWQGNTVGETEHPGAPTYYRIGSSTRIYAQLSRQGYNWLGWCTDPELTGCSWDVTIPSSSTGPVSLYAAWERLGWDITYELNGGTASSTGMPDRHWIDEDTVIDGIPTRSGYVFAGWCTDASLTSCAMSQTIQKNYPYGINKLYAKWTQCTPCSGNTGVNCTVTSTNNVCGYTTSCWAGYGNITNDGAYNASCTQCTGATYSVNRNKGACTNCPTGYTANTTAGKTAREQCQISVSAGYGLGLAATRLTICAAGTYASDTRLVNYGQRAACTQCPDGTVSDAAGATSCEPCEIGYTASADHTSCSPNTYTVTYQAGQGGTGADVSQTATYNADFTTKAANTFTKSNATFVDWYIVDLDMSFPASYTLTYQIASDLTAVARWECNSGYHLDSATGACVQNPPSTYAIKYELNGGTASATGMPTSYTVGVGATINGVPTRAGYTFSGWCTQSNLTSCKMVQMLGTDATGDKTLYARWTVVTYAITYRANDDLSSVFSESFHTYMGTFTTWGASDIPDTKANATFAGWLGSNGKTYAGDTTYTFDMREDLLMTAQWACNAGYHLNTSTGACDANTFTVQYNANSAAATGSTQNSVFTYSDSLDSWASSNGFTNGTSEFLGWAKSQYAVEPDYPVVSTGSRLARIAPLNLTTENNGTVTLYAVWGNCRPCSTVNVSCTLTAQYGVCRYATACLPGYAGIVGNGKYNASCSPCTGNTIASEAGAASCSECRDSVYPLANASHTQCVPRECSIVYRSAPGITTNQLVGTVSHFFDFTTPASIAFSKANARLVGWHLENSPYDFEPMSTQIYDYECLEPGQGYTEFSAIWECDDGYTLNESTGACNVNTYTVTYKAGQGVSAADVSQTATYNADFTTKAANTFTKANATFVDWYIADLDMSFPAGYTLTYQIASDLTAVARWNCNAGYTLNATTGACDANTYTVTLNANGGTGGTASVTATYNSAMPTATMPTRTAYTFAGYYDTSATTGGTQYYTASGASARTWNKTSNTTLYARWNQCTACAAGTGANCSMSVTNNTCTYTTSCQAGYGNLTNSGKYNPSCTANTYKVTLDNQNATNAGTTEYYYQYKTKGKCYYYTSSALTTCIAGTDGITITPPTRTGYVFGGYYTGTNGTGTQYVNANGGTINNLYYNASAANITLYAKWTACTACAAGTGANCSLSVVNNVCTYTTSCQAGYSSITNNGKYNPSCSKCPAGSYCTSGVATPITCPTGFANSAGGATGIGECYRACVVADIEHSTSVTGNVYQNGKTTCDPVCAGGWHKEAGFDLMAEFTAKVANPNYYYNNTSGYIDNFNRYSDGAGSKGQSYYGLTAPNTWAAEIAGFGMVRGSAMCSTQPGDNNGDTYTNPTIRETLVDEFGTGQYCYCNITSYKDANGGEMSLSSPWVFYADRSYASGCTGECVMNCADRAATRSDFRSALFGAVTATAWCEANTYTVTYQAGQGVSAADVSQTATYNADFTTKAANTFTKANATFVDWYIADLDMSFPANYTLTYEIASDLTAVARWECNAGYTLNATTGACTPCAAGTYKGSAGNGTCTPASVGYYVSGTAATSQTACSGATQYQDATGQSNCKNVSTGYYKSSNSAQAQCPAGYRDGAGASAESGCKMTVAAGKYLKAGASAPETCPNGSYCVGGSFAKSTTADQGIETCPAVDSTTTLTDLSKFPENIYPYNPATGTYDKSVTVTVSKFGIQSWGTGWKSISGCLASAQFSNPAGSGGIESISYNPTTNKYDTFTAASSYYWTNYAGYYLSTKFVANYCDNGDHSMLYKRAIKCPAGSYCPGGSVPKCSEGDYNDTWGATTCPTAYPNSDAGATAITKCYSGTKSRAWSGSQTACSKPTNCASVTCNTCSIGACEYTAYSNSAGTGDGTVKTGCSTNNASCQQTVKSVTANAGYYAALGGADYTPLEYIESTGTQYINTGYTETSTTAVDAKFYIVSNSSDYLYGSSQNSSRMMYNALFYNNALEYNWLTVSFTASSSIEMSQSVSGNLMTIKINDTEYVRNIGTSNGGNIYIAASNNGARPYHGGLRIYYFKIKDGATVARDFVPAKRNSDGAIGLYDVANNKFYPNAGQGSFVAGPISANYLTCSACSGLASRFYPNSVAGNTGGASACYTNNLIGKYVKTANDATASTCDAGTAKAAHTVNYGSTSSCGICSAANTYSAAGASTCTACETGYTANAAHTSCTPNTYKVTLDNQNATNAGTTEYYYQYKTKGKCYYYTSSALTTCIDGTDGDAITPPTRTGYVFGGYYTGTNGTGTQYVNANGGTINNLYNASAANITLYAKWTACTACAEGTGANCSMSVTNNTCTYTTSCQDGYGNLTNSGKYNPSCTANTYTITYELNGGTQASSGVPTSYTYDVGATIDGVPTRDGYTLMGWCTDSAMTSCAMTQTISATTTGNKTFYAKWVACGLCAAGTGANCTLSVVDNTCTYTTSCQAGYTNPKNAGSAYPVCSPALYTVTLNSNGGTGGTASVTATYNSAMPTATMPTRTGYTFAGYYDTNATTGGTQYYTAAGVSARTWNKTSNTTLYARWSQCTACAAGTGANCSLSVVNNVCTYTTSCQAGYYGITNSGKNNPSCSKCGANSSTSADNTASTCTCTSPSPSGYSANGTATGATTSTTGCTAVSYTINYELNDGTQASSGVPTSYTHGVETTVNGIPTRDGYTFAGWCTDSGLTSCAKTQRLSQFATGDKTVYAKWTANTYTVTYQAGRGGVGSDKTDSGIYNTPYTTKPSDTFSKPNAKFVGWYSELLNLSAEANTVMIYSIPSDLTVIAQWECNAGYTLNATTGACDPCGTGTYKSSSGNGTCTACPSGTSTQISTTDMSKYPNTLFPYDTETGTPQRTVVPAVSYFALKGWGNGVASINECAATYNFTTTGGTVQTDNVKYNSTTGKYDNFASADIYYSNAAAGYYLYQKYNDTYCDVGTRNMYYRRAVACPAGSYCTGGTVPKCSSGIHNNEWGKNTCPTGYPNSDAGATAITKCYSGTKFRAWSGTETACATPTNCASATCNSCSIAACEYTAYSNSAGTGDGTVKTGCSTNNASCQQTVKSVTANAGYYANGTSCTACSNAPANAVYSAGGTSSSCPWSCKAGYYGSSANGNTSCAACGSGNYCTGGTSRATCASTVKAGAPSPTSIVSLSSGSWSDSTHAASANDCICNWYFSDDTRTNYLNQGVCSAGPRGSNYTHYNDCRTGYYATAPLGWGNWYTSCTACTNKPANSSYTSYSTPSTMYAEENNCPWQCDANYENSGSSCVACSTKNWTDSKTEEQTVDITNGQKKQTRSCTRPVTYSSTAGGTCSASYGSWTCGSWSDVSVTSCAAGYYNASGMTCTQVGSGYYSGAGTTGRTACPTAYPLSDAGASSDAYCYLTLTAGKQVATAGAGAKDCDAGRYCTSTDNIYKGTAGGTTTYTGTACSSLGGGLFSNSAQGADDATDCYVDVTGGKYVSTNTAASLTNCEKGYKCPDAKVYWNGNTNRSACTGTTYSDATNATSCTTCPTATNGTDVVSYGYWNAGKADDHTTRAGCYANFKAKDISNGNMTTYHCYVDADANSYGITPTGKICWLNSTELKCNGGYYNKSFNSGAGQALYSTLADLWDNACEAVGVGYWSATGSLARTQCSAGLTTIGYGAGADEAGDCGHVLHMGTKTLYLRSTKKTTPSLNVNIGGTIFYGNMSTATKGSMRIKRDGTTYSVHDDSV